MSNVGAIRRASSGDAVIAALAGPLAWETNDRSGTLLETAAIRAAVIVQGGLVLTVVSLAVRSTTTSSTPSNIAALACCLGALVVTGTQTWFLVTDRSILAPTKVFVIVRVAAFVAFAVGWTIIARGPAALLVWPLGAYLGIETAITEMTIDQPHPSRLSVLDVVTSPVHTGLIAGLLGAALVGRGSAVAIAAEAAVSIETVVIFGVAARATITSLSYAERERADRVRSEERSSERHRRAHWIHDEVCADVRTVKIRLAAQHMTTADIDAELDELDHRLRLRQLDEIIASGSVTAAELIQPYLRRAQSAGISLIEVPRYEEASIVLPAPTAEVLRRAVAGLVNNALAAGTRTLAIRLSHDETNIVVAVEDDAGGFDLAAVPAGRGLSALADEVGAHNLVVRRSDAGAVVQINIPWSDAA